MYKLLLFILMFSFLLLMNAMQTDEQLAMQALFEGKRAVNRAAHAAAQQVDMQKLAEGIVSIDPLVSQATALDYLRANLKLDANNMPLPSSFWRSQVEIAVFEVFNENRTFPYTYTNMLYNYSITFKRPGVVLIVRITYPRVFSVISPIVWEVKGAAELVY
ncbi:MAG: hypothetical protein K0R67_968 [Paenibacillus sp.]|jgi:hypothetical protein|nr:hypothetical protein [Paenibacillus sp.]